MSEAKNKRVTIRFSEEEYYDLQKKASSNKMDLSTYARERVLFDVPKIEHQSFEYKVLKGISYCVGLLSTAASLKLSEEEMTEAEEEAVRIMKANGLDEDLIKSKDEHNT